MQGINCFENINITAKNGKPLDLQKQFEDLVKKNPDADPRELGKQLARDVHRQIHEDMGKVKEAVGEKQPKYNASDYTDRVNNIRDEYQKQEQQKTEEKATREKEAQEEDNKTGIKNKISKTVRAEMDLPEVEIGKRGPDTEVLSQGKNLVESGSIDPLKTIDRVLADPENEAYSKNESKAMQYYMRQLESHGDDLLEQYHAEKNPDLKAALNGQLQQLSDLTDRATAANIIAGRGWSDIGDIRKIMVDKNFNPSREKAIIKEARGGEMSKQAEAAFKERDEAIKQRTILEEKLREKEAENAMLKLRKDAAKKTERAATMEELKKEQKDLVDQLKKAFKKDLGNLHAGIPIPKESLEVLGKLAVNLIKQGANSIHDVVDQIHAQIGETGLSKKAIRDMLSQYVSEAETERLGKKATGLEKKVKEGVPTLPTKRVRINFEKSNEWVRANQRVSNAEFKIRQEKRKAFESKKNMLQKGLLWLGRLARLSVLSGVNVLYKLSAAATIGSATGRIPEQIVGAGLNHIFKGIAEKAPMEGFSNIDAEMSFYKEMLNPLKFIDNTAEILRTGESHITKKFGTATHEHIPGLYVMTDLHTVIKDPVRRGAYEWGLRNGLIWAEKNGLNINDPLIRESIEQAAFKRAQSEIFLGDNQLSTWFKNQVGKLEKSDPSGVGKFVADFMIPVSKVPTNIVRRIWSLSPGGATEATIRTIQAYRKGLENLSNEDADLIMNQLKKGSVGSALWLVGFLGYKHYGGMYTRFAPTPGKGELNHDEMEVDGKMIPKPVQHAVQFELIQSAATFRRIFEESNKKGDSGTKAVIKAFLGSGGALLEQVPIIETPVHAIQATQDPYEEKKLEEDLKRRGRPQILQDAGVLPKENKKEVPSSGSSPAHKVIR